MASCTYAPFPEYDGSARDERPVLFASAQLAEATRLEWSGRVDLSRRPPGPESERETTFYWLPALCSASNMLVWVSNRQQMEANRIHYEWTVSSLLSIQLTRSYC